MNININIGTDLVYIPKFKNLDRAAWRKSLLNGQNRKN